jgi:glycosyltransferase involved in cell wall biosynthesis
VGSVAIVHDYVVERGGSERVLLSMHRAFPTAPIHTAFFRPESTFPEFGSLPVRPFAINRVKALRNNHRAALPLLPTVFRRTEIHADVVICGTSGWSAGISTAGRKVLYMHAPTRWLNDQEAFLAGRSRVERAGLRLLEGRLRRWDQRAVRSGDRHLVGSAAMADMINALYGVEPVVLAPPVAIDPLGDARQPLEGLDDGFMLCPTRLVASKHVGTVIDAFRSRPDDLLVVAGGGPELARLRAMAPSNVALIGPADDAEMRWLFAHCRAVVAASHEAFGLITVEAAAFGKPSVVLQHGGFVDTVIDGTTGVFFDQAIAREINEAVDRLDSLAFDPARLRSHASQWNESTFVDRLRAVVDEVG